ncbi:hypothetical protein [Bacillus toyonensis]|uniref:hypothetical protein n=1 Tax=Bacillus toyonensis TaxID=155322 RepID=UPI00211EC3DB|nr:hypothetical protein [Bacillus toyonensis]
MGINKKEEQIRMFVQVQEEIKHLIQYVYEQWERDKNEQLNTFPKLAYIDIVKLEHAECYQRMQNLSIITLQRMTMQERKKVLVQIQEIYEKIKSIVNAVIATMHKYPLATGDLRKNS